MDRGEEPDIKLLQTRLYTGIKTEKQTNSLKETKGSNEQATT